VFVDGEMDGVMGGTEGLYSFCWQADLIFESGGTSIMLDMAESLFGA
jgi:hypothetical protein